MSMATKKAVKLKYSLVPNTLPGSTGYHRSLTHIDSRDGVSFFEDVASNLPGQTAVGAELVWNSMVEAIAENLAKYQYRVSIDGNTFEQAIPGSTESVNGAPSEGVYVSVTPSAALRSAVADIAPTYSDSEMDTPALKSVEDLAAHKLGQIVATEPFRLVGNNITAEGDDETITVVAADGTEAVAEVIDEDGLGAFIDARLSTALPPGKGKVVLKTHGKRTPEGELRTLVRSVTILAGEPTPPPEPIAETSDGLVKVMSVADDETGDTFTYGDTWSVRGEGFTGTAPGWAVNMAFVQLEPEAEDPVVLDFDVRGAAEIKLDSKAEHPVAAGDYPDAKLLIEFCHPDGEDPETQVSETLEMPIHIVSNE